MIYLTGSSSFSTETRETTDHPPTSPLCDGEQQGPVDRSRLVTYLLYLSSYLQM